ncbi:ankyrin repeat-containing domain protein [Podospora fimiseda]|uniref:Ankyrin repeat-containing domain protein n=1 Tax=Podospora fimiseda TaxID=252190 RepID=A0AAN7BY97_9PEZI|nr:ankyrin repeat-containing domain protein [Podospora fimiseda]
MSPQDNPKVISVNDRWQLAVGQNLDAALMHLRDRDAERNLWIYTICINQSLNPAALDERSQQVQSMAKIYALATRVLVWLAGSADESDQALDEILKAAESSKKPAVCNQAAILALLGRSWFRRSWVLQEVAAARQILIKCGAIDGDGYVFCLGLNAFDHLSLPASIYPVAFLIRGAIFRSRRLTPTMNQQEGRFSLKIRPLGKLFDMYYTREAIHLRDKAYALLGMCSDDSSTLRLSANYQIPWEQVFQQLIRSIVPDQVSVDTRAADDHAAVLKCRGYFLERITSVNRDSTCQDRQQVEIAWKNFRRAKYFLQVSVSPLEPGDLIFLMEGAANPTVIKLKTTKHWQPCFWLVKMISVPIPKVEFEALIQQEASGLRSDCTLVWRLDASRHGLTDEQLTNEERIKRLDHGGLAFKDARNFNKALWYQGKTPNVLQQLAKGIFDSGNLALDFQPESAMKDLESVLRAVDEGSAAVKELNSMIELFAEENGIEAFIYLAAFKGYCELLNFVFTTFGVQFESESELRVVDYDGGEDSIEDTLLHFAARRGHPGIVRLILSHDKANPGVETEQDNTAMHTAASTGRAKVVKALLDDGRINPNAENHYGQTALHIAAGSKKRKHTAVVKVLADSDMVDINITDNDGLLPLLYAVNNETEAAMVLLATGKVDTRRDDVYWAVVVALLLEMGDISLFKRLFDAGTLGLQPPVNRNASMPTLLHLAAADGNAGIVELVLDYGGQRYIHARTMWRWDLDSDEKNQYLLTPLKVAEKQGHRDVAKMLRFWVGVIEPPRIQGVSTMIA